MDNGGLQGSKQVERGGQPLDRGFSRCFVLQVFVAGDDAFERDLVSGVVRGAVFTTVDLGGLSSARAIEDMPFAFFPQWRIPFYIHLAIFSFLYVLAFVKNQVSVLVVLSLV